MIPAAKRTRTGRFQEIVLMINSPSLGGISAKSLGLSVLVAAGHPIPKGCFSSGRKKQGICETEWDNQRERLLVS
jgi:hypothetical protein